MKKRTYPSTKMGRGGIPDDLKLYMIPPECRAEYLRRRAAQSELRKLSPDREAKKTLAWLPLKPSVNSSNHLQTPIKNDIDSKRSRALNMEVDRHESTAAVTNQRFRLLGIDIAIAPCSGESTKKRKFLAGSSEKPLRGEDVVTNRSNLESLPGSSSGSVQPVLSEKTLDLFPVPPIKIVVDLELSLGCGNGNRKDLEKKMKKKADQELESDGAPIKNGADLELSLASGSGNWKALVKEKKKAGHGLESDGALCCVHPVAPQAKN